MFAYAQGHAGGTISERCWDVTEDMRISGEIIKSAIYQLLIEKAAGVLGFLAGF
jgi:hypothetical protein